MRTFFVYIIRCHDRSLYIGHTDNLEKRWAQHQHSAYGGYTSSRHPLALVHWEECGSRIDALERERQLKGWSRAKKEALIEGAVGKLQLLAKGLTGRVGGEGSHPSTGSG